MLAIGDALALCLMEQKGFKVKDFAQLHPGGSIGKKITTLVYQRMHTGKQNPMVKMNEPVSQALLAMTRTRMGATHVIDGHGRLVGFFTDGDLRRQLQKNSHILKEPIKNVMTKKPCTIGPHQSLYDALQMLQTRGIDNLPVVNAKGQPIGIIDERDLLT
jgi:arabinose-5-phosphate isomerase